MESAWPSGGRGGLGRSPCAEPEAPDTPLADMISIWALLVGPAMTGREEEAASSFPTFAGTTRRSVLVCSCGLTSLRSDIDSTSFWPVLSALLSCDIPRSFIPRIPWVCPMLFEVVCWIFGGYQATGPASTARASRRSSSTPGLAGTAV